MLSERERETGQCDVYDDQNECPDPRTYVNVDGRDGYVKLGSLMTRRQVLCGVM